MLGSSSLRPPFWNPLSCSPNGGRRHCTEQAQGEVCTETKRKQKKKNKLKRAFPYVIISHWRRKTHAGLVPQCKLCSRIALLRLHTCDDGETDPSDPKLISVKQNLLVEALTDSPAEARWGSDPAARSSSNTRASSSFRAGGGSDPLAASMS